MIPRLKGERNRDGEGGREGERRGEERRGEERRGEERRESWPESEEGKQKQREIDLESHSVG